MKRWITLIFLSLLPGFLWAQSPPADPSAQTGTSVGIDEKLGQTIPLDLVFNDESGRPVKLKQLVDRPTLLLLVYFRCPGVCSPFLNGAVEVLDKLDLKADVDYRTLVVSFNPAETPDLAAEKKRNYLKSFHPPIPETGMRFLTGSPASIRALTAAVGFRYKPQGDDFLHPVAMIVLSPEGKIVRYLYGIDFLPFDVKMAIHEASIGRVGPSIDRVLLYCFSYDPDGRKYVFNLLKVTGTLMVFFLACFVTWLAITTRRSRRQKEKEAHVEQ
jgi:protein SCO1/2